MRARGPIDDVDTTDKHKGASRETQNEVCSDHLQSSMRKYMSCKDDTREQAGEMG